MKFLKGLVKVCLVLFVLIIIGVCGLYLLAYLSPALDIKNTGHYYIYDSNNSLVYQGSSNSKWISLDDVSSDFIDAIVSVEDKNFYKHNGFDYLRIAKTMVKNILNKQIVGGASTISQQYVKNLYLDFDKTWERKIEEAWLTINLEVHYSKDEILEGYINTINFGQGNFGIENASLYYFNKSASDLTKEEAIMIAGIPKGPSYYNPVSDYDSALDRAEVVALAMVNNNKLTMEEYDNLYTEKLEIYGVLSRCCDGGIGKY
jgi:membrane peptidoglycan carboxypeptidase